MSILHQSGSLLSPANFFDPASAPYEVIATPPCGVPGHWAGACSVAFCPDESAWFIYYRLRQPRPVRGGQICIVKTSNLHGTATSVVWSSSKEAFQTESIEKSALVRRGKNDWLLFVSYVDGASKKWRIDVLRASSPSQFDPSNRQVLFTAESTGTEGVKDPHVHWDAPTQRYYMYITAAVLTSPSAAEVANKLHVNGDVHTTGLTQAVTICAESADGLSWSLPPLKPASYALASDPTASDAWDRYCTRVTSVMRLGPLLIAFYDGAASVDGNCEERCGIAVSLRSPARLHPLSVRGPVLTSPHSSGSLRYLEVVADQSELHFFYEIAREDGAHELRHTAVPLAKLFQ